MSKHLQARLCNKQGTCIVQLSVYSSTADTSILIDTLLAPEQLFLVFLNFGCGTNVMFMQVGFAILGFISGSVGLRGKFVPQGDNKDTVKVTLCLYCNTTVNTSSQLEQSDAALHANTWPHATFLIALLVLPCIMTLIMMCFGILQQLEIHSVEMW